MAANPVKWNISVAGGTENNENLYSLRKQRIQIIFFALTCKSLNMRVKIMNFHIPLVAASEEGTAQTHFYSGGCKVVASGALFKSHASEA